MVEYQKEVEIAKWLMSRGYSEFDFRDGLWMEDTVLDHSWRDIIELMNDYAAAQAEVRPDTAQQAQPAIAAIQGALRIEALWLPAFIEKGHEGEAEALHAMRNSFLSVLQQQSGG